jgi:protein AFG1
MVIVEDVPQMSGHCYNEARRFVIFVDALYEARTKLVIAANVPRDDLFWGFDATVETNDGDEEIVVDAATSNSGGDTFVIGEGGSSSSSSTTMIRANDDKTVEWSATGRIGVSLAQLSAVKEVSFSFQRAESRLAEMTLAGWGR